jgi:hypothetical protein
MAERLRRMACHGLIRRAFEPLILTVSLPAFTSVPTFEADGGKVTDFLAVLVLVPASAVLMAAAAIFGVALFAVGHVVIDVGRHLFRRKATLPSWTVPPAAYSPASRSSTGGTAHA